MTSELKQVIQRIRAHIENNNVICPLGFDGAFRDPEANQVYLRKFNDNDIEQFGMADNLGNFFYLRFAETERATFSDAPRVASCRDSVTMSIDMRAIFIYEANDQFEVGDYLMNVLQGTHIDPFQNVSNVDINFNSIDYDYFNWNDEDTGGIILHYMPYIKSCAIDFTVNFRRDLDICRNPPNLVP
jgi:hypothetical protein